MTLKLAKIIATALQAPKLAGQLHHNYMRLSGDLATDIATAVEATFPGIDSDYAYETAFHAIHGQTLLFPFPVFVSRKIDK